MRYGIYENGKPADHATSDWEAISIAKNKAAWSDAGIIEVFDFEADEKDQLIWTNKKEQKQKQGPVGKSLLEEAKDLLEKANKFHESIFITGRPLTIDGKTIDHTLLNEIGDGSQQWLKRYKEIMGE